MAIKKTTIVRLFTEGGLWKVKQAKFADGYKERANTIEAAIEYVFGKNNFAHNRGSGVWCLPPLGTRFATPARVAHLSQILLETGVNHVAPPTVNTLRTERAWEKKEALKIPSIPELPKLPDIAKVIEVKITELKADVGAKKRMIEKLQAVLDAL